MARTGQVKLYLVLDMEYGWKLTNWPATLQFQLLRIGGSVDQFRASQHNMGVIRRDFWFYGPEKRMWHGYQIGENTQLAHCRRLQTARLDLIRMDNHKEFEMFVPELRYEND